MVTPEQWKEFREANRANWDDRTGVHYHDRSGSYDVQAFLDGESTLHDIERKTLGDVRGKRLLHLMCHFGMDTLSWARLGAQVTGVDFSPKAIAQANELKRRSGLEALFVESDVYELPSRLDETFDIVIASYGILCWLPDVEDFFCVARHFLRPGGTFLLINDHPFFDIFDYNEAAGHLEITYPYRFQEEPLKFDSPWSYIDHNEPMDSTVSYEWIHDMGSILAAVSASGLELAALREYPYSFYKAHPHMVEAEKGKWIIPGVEIPMILELECRRP